MTRHTPDNRSARREPGARLAPLAVGLTVCLLLPACQQYMGKQPSFKPQGKTDFFADHRNMRALPVETVARGQDRAAVFNEDNPDNPVTKSFSPVDVLLQTGKSGPGQQDFSTVLPFEMKLPDLERGRERFNIFCALCHARTGSGDGKIVQRGFTKPPSFLVDNSRGYNLFTPPKKLPLREVPLGYIYNVITYGYGAMPEHAAQIPLEDRWKIAAYVRALQVSQTLDRTGLSEDEQRELKKAEEGKKSGGSKALHGHAPEGKGGHK